MADIDVDSVEEIVETGVIRKTVRKSYIIQEVSNFNSFHFLQHFIANKK